MKTLLAILVSTATVLGAFGPLAAPVQAAGIDPVEAPAQIILAASDCYAIGEQVAADKGGTLAKASQSTQGGQAVCVIVVLVPGKDGQRPRRTEVVVPQG